MRLSNSRLVLAGIVFSAERVSTPIDNDQVRVLDVTAAPGEKRRLHEHKINRVMIYLDAGSRAFRVSGEGPKRSEMESRSSPVETGSRHARSRNYQLEARSHHRS